MREEQKPASIQPDAGPEKGTRNSIEGGSEQGQTAATGTSVVGIGASAGGLEAFKTLLAHLPPDAGFAVVLIQHLDPAHHSMLSEILGRTTRVPVKEAADGMAVEPNHVYVIPPNAELTITNRVLKLTPRGQTPGPHMPIDRFLRSLAEECGSKAVGVILSGAGTDGAAGLQAIKEMGGVTFAQDPETAEFPSMPRAAEASTCVDFILSPERIAAELVRIARHPYLVEPLPPAAENQFLAVYTILREATGIDFSLYRPKTMHRRILRRVALRNVGSTEEYVHQLENDPGERSALQRDLLISVTSFFRDPESFEALKKLVFPKIVQNRSADETIRIWVPGCATGEEAYSIAILLQEYLEETGKVFPVQIFASDLSEAAIEKARGGKYLANIAPDVGPGRLDRYFTKDDAGYLISKAVREMCVFSRHNLIDDPPFARLDLISCRNVLIYLGSVQKDIISRFHYALKQDGFLFLGRSETASFGDLFSAADGDHRIYAKRGTAGRRYIGFHRAVEPGEKTVKAPVAGFREGVDVRKEVDRILLSRYSPAGVVVDERLEVLEIRGRAAPYLSLPTGTVSFDLLKLIPDTGFYLEVEKLVHEAQASGEAARGERIEYEHDGSVDEVDIEVVPLHGERQRAHLILFEPRPSVPQSGGAPAGGQPDREIQPDDRDRHIAKLRQEIADARQRLLSIVEEHRISSEENQNATEETLSANEELQSLNEELETAKEELQSTNEELLTLNQEMQSKNAALIQSRHFAMSIVETVREPLLVLDAELRIKTANPAFYSGFATLPQETEGRLLYSVCGGGWDIAGLREVLDRVLPGESSFRDFEVERDFPRIGHRVLVFSGSRLDHLDLILLAIEDVTLRREAEKALREREEHLRQVQKMEAIGRLAGGIAHDFNNLLTAIIGYSDLLLHSLRDDEANAEQVQKIKHAGERAASLTDQLLAFSRRKILQPKILDFASVLADFQKMLRRLLDDRIRIVASSAPDLWRVRVDPGEITRVLMNLCLNARDAMPNGGNLTIETTNVTMDEPDARVHDLAAGRYVLLSVQDSGIGMAPEMHAHIFEPFFTTKETGTGKGLGLATVLGIIEQSGGAIWCDSELGEGTTFKILLPAVVEVPEKAEPPSGGLAQLPRSSSEVVLLVEDEDLVRQLVRRILQGCGYVVLGARNGREALTLCETHPGPIHLLLSDVVMPELGGRELAERAAILRPDIKVLFMSGHTQDVVLREGIKKGTPFLEKPFTTSKLANKVREVLDSKVSSQPAGA
jgi:two-component system, chemotaxis family, CheB/CheR fusion protein